MNKAPFLSKKNVAAREFVALSIADIQKSVSAPTIKHLCKRKHRWVKTKYNRRCTRCGLEETFDAPFRV